MVIPLADATNKAAAAFTFKIPGTSHLWWSGA